MKNRLKVEMMSIMGILFIVSSCIPFEEKLSCSVVLRGKIVGTHPLCAGIVIQILSGTYSHERVDVARFNAPYDTITSYRNVFTVYPCDVENTQLDLADMQPGMEFNFVFTQIPVPEECHICHPLVYLPQARNQIRLVGNCENMGEE